MDGGERLHRNVAIALMTVLAGALGIVPISAAAPFEPNNSSAEAAGPLLAG